VIRVSVFSIKVASLYFVIVDFNSWLLFFGHFVHSEKSGYENKWA
jgi:hypothetical protein